MKVTISVTPEDIASGKRGMCFGDPAWLAICRAFPAAEEVGMGTVCVDIDGYDVQLPDDTASIIRDYDEGGVMEPFSFEIDVPEDIAPTVTP